MCAGRCEFQDSRIDERTMMTKPLFRESRGIVKTTVIAAFFAELSAV
jgi:hypothetical protein